jgi:hypothetical protein
LIFEWIATALLVFRFSHPVSCVSTKIIQEWLDFSFGGSKMGVPQNHPKRVVINGKTNGLG